jgi:hypothetical protein
MGLWVLILGLAAAAPPDDRFENRSVLFLPVQARSGVTADLAEQLTSVLAATVATRHPELRVVTLREIDGVMTPEQIKQAAGCDSSSCAAEIAGALNTDEIVLGTLGRVGNSFLITLTRVQAKDGKTLSRLAERTSRLDEEALFDRMGVIADLLIPSGIPQPTALVPPGLSPAEGPLPGPLSLERAAPAPSPTSTRAWLPRTLWATGAVTGGLGLLGLAVTAVLLVGSGVVMTVDYVQGGGPAPLSQAHAIPKPLGMAVNVALWGSLGTGILVVLLGVLAAGLVGTGFVVPS